MGRPKPWNEVTDEEKARMAACFCTGDCTPMTPDCGAYPRYPDDPPRDEVGELRTAIAWDHESARQTARQKAQEAVARFTEEQP